MTALLAIVTSWGRPDFLRRTLQSLSTHFAPFPCRIVVVDNGSDSATRAVIIDQCHPDNTLLWETNRGINAAIEAAISQWLIPSHRWVLISDADMEYEQSPADAINLLESRPEIGAVSFQHSPEHPFHDSLNWNGRIWPLKQTERGCSLLLRAETLQRVRPLPVHNLKDFDWWVCRDAPTSLQAMGESIAILTGGSRHLGWRAGDSTWQPAEIPEYAEYRH